MEEIWPAGEEKKRICQAKELSRDKKNGRERRKDKKAAAESNTPSELPSVIESEESEEPDGHDGNVDPDGLD